MSTSNPFTRNANTIVDDTLGVSYRVVRTVYDNLEDIILVALNMSAVQQAANNVRRLIVELAGETGVVGQVAAISLPEEVADGSIMDFNVIILGNNDALYSAAEGYFTTLIEDRYLKITLTESAPETLENAAILATVYYKG